MMENVRHSSSQSLSRRDEFVLILESHEEF